MNATLLASIGLSGSGEYASANEVQNAINKQQEDQPDVKPEAWRMPTGKYRDELATTIVEKDPKYALRLAVQGQTQQIRTIFKGLTADD